MAQKETNKISSFLEAATQLDQDMAELARIAGSIDAIKIDTDKGLDKSGKLLMLFDECRRKIGSDMAQLGRALEEARDRIEKATERASERATEVQERHQVAESLLERFRNLGAMVAQATETAAELGATIHGGAPAGAEIGPRLIKLNEELNLLAGDAKQLKEEATQAPLKTLERSADALRQRLAATSKKIAEFTDARFSSAQSS